MSLALKQKLSKILEDMSEETKIIIACLFACIFVSILLVLFVPSLFGAMGAAGKAVPNPDQLFGQTTPTPTVTSPTPFATPFVEPTVPPATVEDAVNAVGIATEYAQQDTTYVYDGIPATLKAKYLNSQDGVHYVQITYNCTSAGYGNRSGNTNLALITPHTANIGVQNNTVVSAYMDGVYNMMTQKLI